MARSVTYKRIVPALFVVLLVTFGVLSNLNGVGQEYLLVSSSSSSTTQSLLDSTTTAAVTVSDALENRLICIERIRKRQWETLSPFFAEWRGAGGVSEKNPLLLIDPAYHQNFGDVLLTYGEYAFLERIWNHNEKIRQQSGSVAKDQEFLLPVDECHYVQAREPKTKLVEHCDEYLTKKSHLESNNSSATSRAVMKKFSMWHAGGNWGDMYGFIQIKRILSLELLLKANYSILGMPQSLFYQSKEKKHKHASRIHQAVFNGVEELLKAQGANHDGRASESSSDETKKLLARSRVVLTWREQQSYEIATRLYPFVTNLLVPDIAFQVGPFWNDWSLDLPPPSSNNNQSVDILFFLRRDSESMFQTEREGGATMDALIQKHSSGKEKNLSYRIVDWMSRHELFGDDDDVLSMKSAIQLLKLGRIVVCDRLHAAILSYLSGVPFVYLDQVSNKVTNVLNVAFMPSKDDHDHHNCTDGHKHMWAKAFAMDDAVATAIRMLRMHDL